MIARRIALALVLAGAACAPQQKVKSAAQASAEARKSQEKPAAPKAAADEKPAAQTQPTPPPAPEPAPPPEKPAEPPAAEAKAEAPASQPETPIAPLPGPRGGLCVEREGPVAAGSGYPGFTGSGPAVIALPPSEKAAVAVQVQFRAGAIDDPKGKAGLTALTAALMAEGGTASLDAKALRETLFPFATNVGVRVDKELTTFQTRLHRDHLEKVLPIFSEVLLKPRLDEKEFGRLRDQALNDVEKRLRQGDDENLGKEALYELIYRGHPYGRLTLGHAADLRSITLEDVKAHAARVFTADRITVGVSGGYPEGLGADLSKVLGTLPGKGAAPIEVPGQKTRGLRYLLVDKQGASTAISLGLPYGLSRAHPDYFALSVARSAFGEHRQFNGRLMQRLREQRGLNYGDYAYIEHFVQQGGEASQAQLGRIRHQQDFSIWLRPVQNENALFGLRAALYELRLSLAEEPFNEQEVESTKAFLAGYLFLFDQTDSRKLGHALDDQALGLHRHPGFLDTWRRKVSEVTAAQVNEAWRRWIDPCSLQIVLVTGDAAAVKKTLLSGEATPMHYQRDAQGKSAEKPAALLDRDRAIQTFSFGQPKDEEIEIVPVEKMFE